MCLKRAPGTHFPCSPHGLLPTLHLFTAAAVVVFAAVVVVAAAVVVLAVVVVLAAVVVAESVVVAAVVVFAGLAGKKVPKSVLVSSQFTTRIVLFLQNIT